MVATLPDGELRAVARDCLGAQRMSVEYLQALRVVLGNQASAEREGHVLELNIRTDFATERVMRTIINQMKVAGITSGRRVLLGRGRVQVIQVFEPSPCARHWPTSDLCAVLRREEARLAARYGHRTMTAAIPACISEGDLPY